MLFNSDKKPSQKPVVTKLPPEEGKWFDLFITILKM